MEENSSEKHDPSELKEKALLWRKEGKSISEIRLLLQELCDSDDLISTVIQEIDKLELESIQIKEEKKQLISRMAVGGILSISGVIVTLILSNKQSIEGLMYLYTFGPMIAGYVIFKTSFQKYKKLKEKELT